MQLTEQVNFDRDAFEYYKVEFLVYKNNLSAYETQQRAITNLINFIQETITVENALYIEKMKSHSWDQLRALQTRLTSTNVARLMNIETRYRKLCKGLDMQDIETYLKNWQMTYTEAKAWNIEEISDNRSIRDFLVTLSARDPIFSQSYMMHIDDDKTNLFDLIEKFRRYIRMSQTTNVRKVTENHFAFSAQGPSVFSAQRPTFNDQAADQSVSRSTSQQRRCLCGLFHSWSDCFYMVPERRPIDWTADPTKQARIDEALRNDKTRTAVQQSIQSRKEYLNQINQTNQSNQSHRISPDIGAFTAARTALSISRDSYSIRSSWILDNEANNHVCNSTMRSRFVWEREASSDDFLMTGTQRLSIKCFEIIKILVATPTDLKEMTLLNVAYIADFRINLVSKNRLYVKSLYFDHWKLHLHRDESTMITVKRYNEHYLLKNNITASASTSASASAFASASALLKSLASRNSLSELSAAPAAEEVKKALLGGQLLNQQILDQQLLNQQLSSSQISKQLLISNQHSYQHFYQHDVIKNILTRNSHQIISSREEHWEDNNQMKSHKNWDDRKYQDHTDSRDDYSDVFDKDIKNDLHQENVSGLSAY
jgi:hypothetical protein